MEFLIIIDLFLQIYKFNLNYRRFKITLLIIYIISQNIIND